MVGDIFAVGVSGWDIENEIIDIESKMSAAFEPRFCFACKMAEFGRVVSDGGSAGGDSAVPAY